MGTRVGLAAGQRRGARAALPAARGTTRGRFAPRHDTLSGHAMLARLSPELRLMLAPTETYRRLLRQPSRSPRNGLGRLLLVGLVVGTSVALGATGRVSLGLVLSCALCWSVAPLAQALALAACARPSPLPYPRLLELFLLTHAPWSLWLLCVSLGAALSFPEGSSSWTGAAAYAYTTALLPALWTPRL